jgi:hypothetical protein
MSSTATRAGGRRPIVFAQVCAGALTVLRSATHASGQTYYVNAATGSDSNTGLSPTQAWQSLTNVNDTNFSAGSSILFADGDNFYGNLTATSSGTASNPITYGSYYSGTGPMTNPTFWGSDPVAASSFTGYANVNGDETYSYTSATTINSFLVNDQFAHSALLVSGQTTAAANVSYVENNANTWYYNTTNSTLYVDPGASISSSNLYTVGTRENVISSGAQSNLVFTNLNTAETASVGGLGYGYIIQGGANVTVENASVTGAGVHGVAALDTTGFVGKNLSASNFMPDQGYGGSSAFVAYSDSTVSAPTTSTWINDTFTNPNGNYAAFITHSTPSASVPSPIGSVTVQNMSTTSSLAMAIYTNPNEQVSIQGGTMSGFLQLYGNNILVNGVTMVGSAGQIYVNGNNNIVQNSIINGAEPDWNQGFPGALVDNGTNNIYRYNTIMVSNSAVGVAAAIALLVPTSGSQFYGNIITTPYTGILEGTPGPQTAQFFDNLFFSSDGNQNGFGVPAVLPEGHISPFSLATETDFTNDNAIYADPMFVNPDNGDFYLLAGSPALYVFDPTMDEYVPFDIYGDPRAWGLTDLGAVVPEPAALSLLGAASLLSLRRIRRSPGKP